MNFRDLEGLHKNFLFFFWCYIKKVLSFLLKILLIYVFIYLQGKGGRRGGGKHEGQAGRSFRGSPLPTPVSRAEVGTCGQSAGTSHRR